jgi:hypothetical protein
MKIRSSAASSGVLVVSPCLGWMPGTGNKARSAVMLLAASTAAAPDALTPSLWSRPPRMKTFTVGWLASAVAVDALCVMIVASRSGGSAATTSRAVVPPPRMALTPGVMSWAARAATRRLLSGAIANRLAWVPSAGETGSAPP